jgi:NAD(P)-dependent dehydrogenase (short-subunit alcohol dehydrogenase family)
MAPRKKASPGRGHRALQKRGAQADRKAQDVAKFGGQTVMKRPAQPEEIAPACVFLASPQCSSFITGEILSIIGGYSGGWAAGRAPARGNWRHGAAFSSR